MGAAVKEYGVMFTAPNVRLIRQGLKVQTRRPLYVPTKHIRSARMDTRYPPDYGAGEFPNLPPGQAWTLSRWIDAQAGDRMWVRETWAAHWMYNDVPPREARSSHPNDNHWYAADPDGSPGTHGCPASGRGKWRPPMFMPRWACRQVLDITKDARVERLSAITNRDAIAEGAQMWDMYLDRPVEPDKRTYGGSFVLGYKRIWQGLYAGGPMDWDRNPWVVVIDFRPVTE